MIQTVLLGDIAEKITKGTTPTTYGASFTDTGVNFIKVESITSQGGFLVDKFVHIDKMTHENMLKRSIIQEGDILLTMAGAIGRVAQVPKEILPANTNQAVSIIRVKADGVDGRYIRYFLESPNAQDQFYGGITQSAQPNLSLGNISKIQVPLPEFEVQKKIANILGTIDEKIELNRKMNETLEQMGQALFRHYFIDNSEAKSWEEKSLDDIAHFLNGLAMQKYPQVEGEPTLPVIKIREMSSGITENTDIASASIPERYIIGNGDLLFSWSGTLLLKFWSEGMGALNQHLFKVSSEGYPEWLYYHWTKHHLEEFINIAKSKATTMGHIQRKHLSEAKVLVPDGAAMKEIGNKMQPIIDTLKENAEQIQSLTTLRDTLLPQLIKGNIRI